GRHDVGFPDRKDKNPPFLRAGAAGGAAFGYGYETDWSIDPAKPDQWVWMTGDALCNGTAPCFNPDSGAREDGSEVHGTQGTPAEALDEASPEGASGPYPAEGEPYPATGPLQSWMIDTDENLDSSGAAIMAELSR